MKGVVYCYPKRVLPELLFQAARRFKAMDFKDGARIG
jgi:hypothetical protein